MEPVEPVSAQLAEAPQGRLTERLSLPVTVHEQFTPKELIHTPKDEWVFDLGQEITGISNFMSMSRKEKKSESRQAKSCRTDVFITKT